MEFLDHMIVLFFIFVVTFILFSIAAAPFCIIFYFLIVVILMSMRWCLIVVFICNSLMIRCRISFHVLVGNLYIFFEKCLSISFAQLKKKICLFLLWWVFIALCGLSLVAVNGGYSLLWCVDFSFWYFLLQSTGSRHTGFSSCSTWAQ